MESDRKYCHCKPTCGKLLTHRTRRRHYTKVPPESIRRSVSPTPDLQNLLSTNLTHMSPSEVMEQRSSSPSHPYSCSPAPPDLDMCSLEHISTDSEDGMEVDAVSNSASSVGSEPLSFAPSDSDLDPWSAFDEFQDLDEPVSREEMLQQLEEMLGPGDEQHDDMPLDGGTEASLWDERNNILTEKDRDDIRAFHLKLISKMPRTAYNQMVYAFSHKMDLSSEWVMFHRMALLSGVEPLWFDCCIDSCVAYTGDHADLTHCPYCNTPRYSPTGKVRRMFCYLPIIPRLQGFFQNPKSIQQLLYRAKYVHIDGEISDVFDGEHYRSLRDQNVVLDDKVLDHKHFSGKYDVALGICMDSYLLFKRRRNGPSATPILVKNYNIKPEVRTHLNPLDGGLMSAGVIPGPHPPKDAHSFLIPYDDECALLAVGVRTFNASTRDFFMLHGYTLFELGDIIAIEKSLNIKGHNSFSPCRSCDIMGIRNVTGGEKVYYVPLTWPNGKSWDPENLPMCSPEKLDAVVRKLDRIDTELANTNAAAKAKDTIAKFHGIKGLPALRRVNSLHYPRSRPWDAMHLFFENVVPNLVKLWSGRFKGLDVGTEDYEIDETVREEIWAETAAAMEHIPADFVRLLGTTPSYYTAEAWAFWFVYLAPILLKGRFRDPKYHTHLCEFSDIIKGCLRFTSTTAQVQQLRQDIIRWVRKYEEYYYQYSEERLRVCTLTAHGLLHVPDDILFCGPSWTTWTFFMERYCGILQAGLRSKRFPWANLNQNVLHVAYLEQLNARYDLENELSRGKGSGPRKIEYTYDNYPLAVLIPPYKRHYAPEDDLRKHIADHFAELVGKRHKNILPLLPEIIPSFGKLRVLDGDSIRTASASGDGSTAERDMSFVRYENQTRRTIADPWVAQISYGRLERVLECRLPVDPILGHLSGQKRLLAVISPCTNTAGKDAALKITTYRGLGQLIVTDLQAVVAVVGRMKSQGKWFLVDRTGGLIRPQFNTPDDEED